VKNPSPLAREFLEKGRSQSCPVIDMHGHYGPISGLYLPAPYAEGMLESMDRCGVACLVMSGHAALVDPERGNREIAQVVRDHPGRFYGYRAINPNYAEQTARETARFDEEPGFVGFKLHPDWHSYPLTGDAYLPTLEYAARRRLLVLTHTWGDSEYCCPKLVAEVAAKFPGATFLMGHAGYGDWDGALAVAREHSNCYLELTAAYRIGGIIGRMVAEVGSDRVVFGTDLPWFDPHWGIGAVCFSRIGEEDRHNILHRNAERLLAPFRTGRSG
jgi:predicted TIM-barrel fold metal-dependent hydrolase